MFKKHIDTMRLIGDSNIFMGEVVKVTLDNDTTRIGTFIKETQGGIYLFEDNSNSQTGLDLNITYIPGNKILSICHDSFGRSRETFLGIINGHFGTELK